MYLEQGRSYYTADGTQHAARGIFLILVQTPDSKWADTRAIVRKVALQQWGHWMIGKARAFGESIMISGSYGADGLPRTVTQAVYDRAVPIPAELMEALNKGGGWNGAGSEGEKMRTWAMENLKALAP